MNYARLIYMQFCRETMPEKQILPWEDLPPHIRHAWDNVVATAFKWAIEGLPK